MMFICVQAWNNSWRILQLYHSTWVALTDEYASPINHTLSPYCIFEMMYKYAWISYDKIAPVTCLNIYIHARINQFSPYEIDTNA